MLWAFGGALLGVVIALATIWWISAGTLGCADCESFDDVRPYVLYDHGITRAIIALCARCAAIRPGLVPWVPDDPHR